MIDVLYPSCHTGEKELFLKEKIYEFINRVVYIYDSNYDKIITSFVFRFLNEKEAVENELLNISNWEDLDIFIESLVKNW